MIDYNCPYMVYFIYNEPDERMYYMKLYSTEEAADYLGITSKTLKRYVKDTDIPIAGQLVNPRSRVFTEDELAEFKAGYLTENPAKPGRPWHKEQEWTQQRFADELLNLVNDAGGMSRADRQHAVDAIQTFENAGWYREVFAEVLPDTLTLTADGFDYTGDAADVAQVVETLIRDYLTRVADGGGTVSRE